MPAWASSQSMTARRASGPTMRLPSRRSPWTITGSRAGGRVSLQRAQGQLEDGAGLHRRRRAAPAGRPAGPARADTRRTSSACRPAANSPTWRDQHLPRRAVGGVAQDAAGDRLAGDPAHDQASRAPQVRLLGAEQHLGHGEPGRQGRLDDAGFPAHRARLAGPPRRVAAQHQLGARAAGADRVEGPGLTGRAAGQPGQAVDGDRAQDVAQRGGQAAFVRSIRGHALGRPLVHVTRTCTRPPGASGSPRCPR